MTSGASEPPAIVYGVLVDQSLMAWPGRNQLMAALAARTRVILLQQSSDVRMLCALRRPRLERLDGNLWLVHNAFALTTRRGTRRLGPVIPMIDGWRLRRSLSRAGVKTWIMWLTVAQPWLIHGVPNERLVYDCMDPNFIPSNQETFDRNEFAIARRARVVFASARVLYDRMKTVNMDTYLLPNAAPRTSTQPPAPRPTPAPLAQTVGPVAGYLGTIDWRFDADTMTAVAAALPDVTFVIAGRINRDQEERVARLRALPNVVMPGQVSQDLGEAYTQAFDIGLIPFTPSPMNDAINPVKMYMYLAYGKPVVSTWIAECCSNPWVSATRNAGEFAEAVRSYASARDPVARQAGRDYARVNTWNDRAESAIDVLSKYDLWGGGQ